MLFRLQLATVRVCWLPKMAAPLARCSKEEQRAVIRFLCSEGTKPAEIHRRMLDQYGDACLSLQQVYEWCRKFRNGVTELKDAPRPGQTNKVVTAAAIARVESLIKENRRLTVEEISTLTSLSHGSTHHIIHDLLKFRKVCARWVPKDLTADMKKKRLEVCEKLLKRYEEEGDSFLHCIVTGDESWVHHYQPESKISSMEWRHSTSPKPKKFRTQPSAGKLMLTVFWDKDGCLVEHYMPKKTNVNSETYCDILQNHLKPAIRSKRRGMLSAGVLLQHDNARPHTSKKTTAAIQEMRLQVLEHPPYSPDLAPSDYHLFGPLKKHLGGTKFSSDEEVKDAVHEWLCTRPKSFFSAGIHALVKRWQLCIERQGGYVEK